MNQTSPYPWQHANRYNDYGHYLRQRFPWRVQKLSLDAGFTCPNRDGSKGLGGCIYCNNDSFNPEYCTPRKSVTQQLDEGMTVFDSKQPGYRYLAYFQAYSNTYEQIETLQRLYHEALAHPRIEGLVIGTRPDCVPTHLLDYLAELARQHYVVVEYGLESTLDHTLDFINRCHTHAESVEAVRQTAQRGIDTGAHLILGLPGEDRNDLLGHADRLSELPIRFLKIHQLQVVRRTKLAHMYRTDPASVPLFELEPYIELVVDFLERLRPDIVVERFASQSPHNLLIAPKWGYKNFEITRMVEKRLAERNTWQGRLYRPAQPSLAL